MRRNNKFEKDLKNLIKQEATAVQGLRRLLGKAFNKAVQILGSAKGKIVIAGIGKSSHVGMKIASTMTSLGIPAAFLHPSEAFHGGLGTIGESDALVAISYSGETSEIVKLVRHVQRHKLPIVAIVGNKRSALARLSTVVLGFRVKEEGSPYNLAPMASATASLVVGDMLATALALKRGFNKKDFADLHPGGSLGLQLGKVKDLMGTGRTIPLVRENTSFQKALREVNRKRLGITGVTNRAGRLVGVMSDGDIRRFLLSLKFSLDSPVREAMTENPKKIREDTSLQEALALMEKHKITSLFVVDAARRPIGILHLHAIIEEKIV